MPSWLLQGNFTFFAFIVPAFFYFSEIHEITEYPVVYRQSNPELPKYRAEMLIALPGRVINVFIKTLGVLPTDLASPSFRNLLRSETR
jgi:hypothetical protein